MYSVNIRTGHCKGAGTDANVCITLYSADGATFGPTPLEARKESFDRGCTDTFQVSAPGFLSSDGARVQPARIALEHDNAGDSPDWFVHDVVLACDGLPDARFVLEDWIAMPRLRREIIRLMSTGTARSLKRCGSSLALMVVRIGQQAGLGHSTHNGSWLVQADQQRHPDAGTRWWCTRVT